MTDNRALHRGYEQRWRDRNRDTPRYKYRAQAKRARKRGIPFLLTFEEWWQIWEASGRWTEMGRRRGQYCMSRPGDQGAYEISNVVICPNAENNSERNTRVHTGRPISEQRRRHLSEVLKGYVHSEQTRKRMSEAHTGKPLSNEHCRRISEGRRHG